MTEPAVRGTASDRRTSRGLADPVPVLGVLGALVVAAIALTSAVPPDDRQPSSTDIRAMTVTFYAAYDNDPAGSTHIDYPGRHTTAGGAGTWEDPVTFAADRRFLPPGTVIYEPRLKKYFVMEDSCAPCVGEWTSSREPHVDLWVGNATTEDVLWCESVLAPDGRVPVEVDPPAGRPVDSEVLYDAPTNSCLAP